MPRGKINPRRGGVGWVNRTTLTIDALEMHRLAKIGVPSLGCEVIEKHSNTLVDAFRKYQITRKGAVTATSRRRVRDLIAKRAAKVLLTPKSETWRENLLDALKCTMGKSDWRRTADGSRIPTRDPQFRVELHHLLLGAYRKNDPPTAQLQDLERVLYCTTPFAPSELEALKLLADLPIHLIVNSGKWADPALVDLIKAVGPVWREVTRRSLKHTSFNKEEDKHSHFAIWLGATLGKLGLPSPPQTHITKIVKSLKI